MNIYQVIIAAINAYLEREKARQDEQRTMEIIRAINATVLENRLIIEDALRDWEIDRLTGLYLGQVQNFNEYEPTDDHKDLLKAIAYDTNQFIFGPLINLFDNEDDVPRVRKIVNLMELVVHLRAIVLSELKNRHEDNRDDHLLDQLKYVRACCTWLKNNQYSRHYLPTYNTWRNCENNPPPETFCLPIPGESDSVPSPTSCCGDLFYTYKVQRDFLHNDNQIANKVDESITHLEGIFLLIKMQEIADKTQLRPRCGHLNGFGPQCAWDKTTISYAFEDTITNQVPRDEAINAIKQAFETWRQYRDNSPLTFVEVTDDENPDILIGWRSKASEDPDRNGPDYVLAHAGFPPACGWNVPPLPIHFYDNHNWCIGAEEGKFDIKTVALHEIGHTLGITHSRIPTSVMYSTIEDNCTKRNLGPYDVFCMNALYS